MSPVKSHPSRRTVAVSSGLFQYPFMTCGPRTASSPTWPCGKSFPGSSASTIFASVSGNGIPMHSFTVPLSGLQCVTGDASVSPYPSTRRPPVAASNCFRTSFGSGAAPEMHARIERRSYFARFGLRRIAMYIVGTPGKMPGFALLISLRIWSISRGVGDWRDVLVAWDHGGPVPLLLQVPPFLDRVQLAQRGLEELGDVADDDAFHADLRHRLRDAVPEQVERHDRVHARIIPEDRKLPRGVRGIRLDDDPSRAEDREKGDDEMGRVREHEGNAVSTANPNRSQTGGEPVDCGVEFAVRKRFPVESDRRSGRELLRGSPEQLPDRDVRIGERGWHALGPAAEPRPREGRLPLHARDNASQDHKGTGGPNIYALRQPMEARCLRRRASESTERRRVECCGSRVPPGNIS